MVRIYLDAIFFAREKIALNSMQQHYLKTVMRKKSGDNLLVFNERDGEWSAILQEKSVLLEEKLREPEASTKKYLAVACIKQNRLEIIVEKATEIGINTIFLLQTDRSNSREPNLNRLKSISIEATEQSGRIRPLVIEKPQKMQKFLQNDLKLAYLHPEALKVQMELKIKIKEINNEIDTKQSYEEVKTKKKKSIINVDCIIIGPEGGFSPDELTLLDSLKFQRICLGKNILRTETAAIIAAYLLVSSGI